MRSSDPRNARFPEESNDDFCWFAGHYIGDGFIKHGEYDVVQIAVDPSDHVLIDEVIRVGREQFGLDFKLANDGLRLTARGTAPLASFLAMNGLGGGAHDKRIPEWVFAAPRSQRLVLLAG